MITIKLNPYSDTEKAVLFDLVNEMHVMFNECYCPKFRSDTATCDQCEHRHVCYDVEKIYNYMGEQNENIEKNSCMAANAN